VYRYFLSFGLLVGFLAVPSPGDQGIGNGPVESTSHAPDYLAEEEDNEDSPFPDPDEIEGVLWPMCCRLACSEPGCFCEDCQLFDGPGCPEGRVHIDECPDGDGGAVRAGGHGGGAADASVLRVYLRATLPRSLLLLGRLHLGAGR